MTFDNRTPTKALWVYGQGMLQLEHLCVGYGPGMIQLAGKTFEFCGLYGPGMLQLECHMYV